MGSDIIYLVDCSGSMAKGKGVRGLSGSKLEAVRACLSQLLEEPGAFCAGDRAALLSFRQRSLDAAEVLELSPLQPVGAPGAFAPALPVIAAGCESETLPAIIRSMRLATACMLTKRPISRSP